MMMFKNLCKIILYLNLVIFNIYDTCRHVSTHDVFLVNLMLPQFLNLLSLFQFIPLAQTIHYKLHIIK